MTEQETFNAVVAHPCSDQLVVALDLLNRAEMLSGEEASANFRAVFDHADPITAASVLRYLNRYQLVTGPNAGANRQAAMTHNIVAVERVLKKLSHLPERRNVQNCFDVMIAHATLFLDDKVGKRIWSQLPNNRRITLQELRNMIQIAENANHDEQGDDQRLESLHILLFGHEPPVTGTEVMRQNPNNFFSASALRSGNMSVSVSQDEGQSSIPRFH